MQIKGKLSIKREEGQKYPIFGLRKRAHTGRRRREEEEVESKKAKKGMDFCTLVWMLWFVWNLYGKIKP